MDEFQHLVIEELRGLSRKIERIEDKLDSELQPIKKHVTQVKFVGALIGLAIPLILALAQLVK